MLQQRGNFYLGNAKIIRILPKFDWIFFPSFFAPEQSKDHDEPDDDDAEPEQAVHNDRPRIPVAVK